VRICQTALRVLENASTVPAKGDQGRLRPLTTHAHHKIFHLNSNTNHVIMCYSRYVSLQKRRDSTERVCR
jgi:hypothetical protein